MTLFLIGALALIVWVVSLYLRPFGPCPRCHGEGRIWRGTRTRPRPRPCPRCKGVKRRQRPGSRTVHQLARRVRKYRERQRRERERAATASTFEE
jgi:DnaJ-class molecular chaperone